MAGVFSKIPQDTFNQLQLDAGIVLNNFNPASPNVLDADIVTSTTGGITVSVTPQFEDFGSDIDNCPNNTKELKRITGYDVSVAFTALNNTPAFIKRALGAADIDGVNSHKVTPRANLASGDFADLWWVGDKANGGFIAVKVLNALSTGGYSLKTTKNGKGNVSVTLTGHVSIQNQDVVPVEFYSYDATPSVTYTYTAVEPVGTENPMNEGWYVLVGDEYRPTSDTTVDANVTYYEQSVA